MARLEDYDRIRIRFLPVDVEDLDPDDCMTVEYFRLLDELSDYACLHMDAADIGIAGITGDGDPDVAFYQLMSFLVNDYRVKIPRKYYDAYVAWSKTRPAKRLVGRDDIDSWFEPEV